MISSAHRGTLLTWVVGYAILLCPAVAFSQLLYDEVDEADGYEKNYARYGYHPYALDAWTRTNTPVFDELGDFIMSGTTIWSTEETRPVSLNGIGSVVDKDNQAFGSRGVNAGQSRSLYSQWLNSLVVAHDNYHDWASRLIVGDRIRTKFTALSLDLAAMNGVRWDTDTRTTKISIVASRFDWPIFQRFGQLSTYEDNVWHSERQKLTYLLGGHVERAIGALNVGLSYVNLSRMDSRDDWGDHTLKGVLPSTGEIPPVMIAVKVADGTPRDAGGARVLDMRIDEEWGDLVNVSITRHDTRKPDPNNANWDQNFPQNRSIPPYIQFGRGEFPHEDPGQRGFLEAKETEYLIYWFEIPEDMRSDLESIRFRALVANDYQISISEIHELTSGAGGFGQQASYFYDVAAQEGSVQDGTNLRWVVFEYGRQSGQTVASLRVDLESAGFQVRSEWARSFEFRQYPTQLGRRRWQQRTGNAFFVNAKRPFGRFTLGGEVFTMDPLYGTTLSVQSTVFRTYTDNLGSPFSGEVDPNWLLGLNDTMEMNTVDDNDDKDLFPDFHFLSSQADKDGVFPGLDQDQDGRTDTNANGNSEPDYLEPFFLYDVDPQEYVYGDDLNNNGFIDHREDDRDPDYPYEADSRGLHFFAQVDPSRGLALAAGRYRVEGIWRGGENRVTYASLDYNRALFPYARVRLANTFKRVHDDLPDDTPQFAYFEYHAIPRNPNSAVAGSFTTEVEDELLMRNSVVNTAYLDATFLRVPNLNINNRLKHTLNIQRRTDLQSGNTVRELAWALRADYRWRVRSLTITPKVKYIAYRRQDDDGRVNEISERLFYPMLVADYALTPRTSLRAGAQGMPFLKSQYRYPLNRSVDYSSEDYILMLANTTTYQGFLMSLTMGYQLTKLRFDDRTREGQDVDRALFFLRLLMGVEPFQG